MCGSGTIQCHTRTHLDFAKDARCEGFEVECIKSRRSERVSLFRGRVACEADDGTAACFRHTERTQAPHCFCAVKPRHGPVHEHHFVAFAPLVLRDARRATSTGLELARKALEMEILEGASQMVR